MCNALIEFSIGRIHVFFIRLNVSFAKTDF
jgi:hypothetical protein